MKFTRMVPTLCGLRSGSTSGLAALSSLLARSAASPSAPNSIRFLLKCSSYHGILENRLPSPWRWKWPLNSALDIIWNLLTSGGRMCFRYWNIKLEGAKWRTWMSTLWFIWQKRGQETATIFTILAEVSPGLPSKFDDQALEASTERGIEITLSRKSSTERYYMC